MTSARPPRSHRTARERVAARRSSSRISQARTTTPPRARKQTRGGCNSIFIGLAASLLLAGFMLALLAHLASQTLAGVEMNDVRPLRPDQSGVQLAAEASNDTVVERPDSATLDPFNILLIGVDTRNDGDQGVRGDTLIVVHVDTEGQWASMLSIPRDSMVQVPYLGLAKINAAYTYGYANAADVYGQGVTPQEGGAALAAETVEQFLGIRIKHVAQVDFQGFVRLVDTFGGLTIDVPEPLLDAEYPTANYGYERLYVPAGLQVLDGQTALRYARSRHSGSDFDRSCRQQRVLRAMLREVRQRNLVEQVSLVPDVIEDIQQSVSTTMPISDLNYTWSLVELAQSLSSDRVMQFSINPSNVQVIAENSSDIYWNESDIELLVARWLRGPQSEQQETTTVQVQNAAGERGLAGRVTQNLGGHGFAMIEAGDAPRVYEHTMIIDYTGHPETRQRLADVLGIDTEHVYAEPFDTAPPAPYNTDIVLVVGQDYQPEWAQVSASSQSAPAPAPVPAAPAEEVPNLPPNCSPDY